MHLSSDRDNRVAQGSVAALVAVLTLGVINESGATGVEWGYSGDTGPEHWGKDFVMCGLGRNQSPIDIAGDHVLDIGELVTDQETVGSRPAGFLKIDTDYRKVPLKIVNNGHTVEVEYEPGSTLTVHGKARELKQFHFHSPSENRIGGEAFPLEAHLVHADQNGNLAVIAVMFKEGKPNPFLEPLWAHMPQQAGKEVAVANEAINATDMLPEDLSSYRFNGSLTTPPCSEGVAWLVLKEPLEASKEQLDLFRSTVGFDNNRPVQPINTRVVITW